MRSSIVALLIISTLFLGFYNLHHIKEDEKVEILVLQLQKDINKLNTRFIKSNIFCKDIEIALETIDKSMNWSESCTKKSISDAYRYKNQSCIYKYLTNKCLKSIKYNTI